MPSPSSATYANTRTRPSSRELEAVSVGCQGAYYRPTVLSAFNKVRWDAVPRFRTRRVQVCVHNYRLERTSGSAALVLGE